MSNLTSEAHRRRMLYKTDASTEAAVSLHRSRRKDNVRLNGEVKGRVKTKGAKGYLPEPPEKTGMYEKPACGVLDTQRFLARKRVQGPPASKTGSLLSIPEDAGPEERGRMRRWVAQAEEISRRLNR